jgi:hypothetical protein
MAHRRRCGRRSPLYCSSLRVGFGRDLPSRSYYPVDGFAGRNDPLISGANAGRPVFGREGHEEWHERRQRGTNDGFLNALYQDVLGRAIDPSGQATFTQELASGVTRTQVATEIFSSTEYRQRLVQSYYQSFLHRPADPSGVNGFVQALQAGSTDEEVIASIIGSQEYLQLV